MCGFVLPRVCQVALVSGLTVRSRPPAARALQVRLAPSQLRQWPLDGSTLAQWDWQGEDARLVLNRVDEEDEAMALTWTNIGGDTRHELPVCRSYPVSPLPSCSPHC